MKKLFLVSLLVFIGIAAAVWYQGSLEPVNSDDLSRHTVKIPQGSSVSGIAQTLHERGLIRSPLAFDVYTRMKGVQSSLQAGQFIMKASLSLPEIVDILHTGKAQEMIVTIPEGFTVTDIDTLLAEKELIAPGDFLDCAQTCDLSSFSFLPQGIDLADRGGKVEGYLYPDTYFIVSSDFTAEQFLNRLLHTFDRKVVDGLVKYLEKSERSLHEVVTMASLIEEEASNNSENERSMISDILWKRYDAGLGLGVDATVRYILNKPTEPITVADLNENSAYNTRKFKGLPPGPIASPGYDSVLAALAPRETKYWYYLHAPSGEIHYAVTNEEHNINRHKYLR